MEAIPNTANGPVDLLEIAASVDAGPFNHIFASGAGHRARLTVTTGIGLWHHHPNTPETFIVLEGVLRVDFRDESAVLLHPGMALTVPAGVSHRSGSVRAVSVSLEAQDQQAVLEDA